MQCKEIDNLLRPRKASAALKRNYSLTSFGSSSEFSSSLSTTNFINAYYSDDGTTVYGSNSLRFCNQNEEKDSLGNELWLRPTNFDENMPLKFLSEIWILFDKMKGELMNIEDVNSLLPNSGFDLMTSKAYLVKTHSNSNICDHYSKEVEYLIADGKIDSKLNANKLAAHISVSTYGSAMQLAVVNDDRYDSWMKDRPLESNNILNNEQCQNNLSLCLNNICKVSAQDEKFMKHKAMNDIIEKENNNLVEVMNEHIAKIELAKTMCDQIESDTRKPRAVFEEVYSKLVESLYSRTSMNNEILSNETKPDSQ